MYFKIELATNPAALVLPEVTRLDLHFYLTVERPRVAEERDLCAFELMNLQLLLY